MVKRRRGGIGKRFLAGLTLFMVVPMISFPWGQIGHRIIGEVAARLLSAKAKAAVASLLGEETLAQVSNWADFIRQDPERSGKYASWHSIYFPKDATFEDAARDPKGDVVSGLERLERNLRDESTERETRVEALKLFVHFLGDLHNPFHAGYTEDRGGSQVTVRWFGADTNLHMLWDNILIRHQDLSYTEYVEFLPRVTDQDKDQWRKGSYADWMKESRTYLAKAYPVSQGRKWEYVYNYEHIAFLNERLLQAGVRLAEKLNDIFR
jgi:hypothetical protein